MPHPPESDSGELQLTNKEVTAVVNVYRAHAQRVCFFPRVGNQPGPEIKESLNLRIEVEADGKVKEAKATGGDKYEGLAGCVQDHVKRWRFPKAQLPGTLSFSMVFVRDAVAAQ